jgi:hypothetical protein
MRAPAFLTPAFHTIFSEIGTGLAFSLLLTLFVPNFLPLFKYLVLFSEQKAPLGAKTRGVREQTEQYRQS